MSGQTAQDGILAVQGINAQGFGTIAKQVMRDRRLSIESKAIYAYLCSHSGGGATSFPSVKAIVGDLGIGEKRYYTHLAPLREFGYIAVERGERAGSSFKCNVYTINQVVPASGDDRQRHPRHQPHDGGEPEVRDCGKLEKPQMNGVSRFDSPQLEKEGYTTKPQMNGASRFDSPQLGLNTVNIKPYGFNNDLEIENHMGFDPADPDGIGKDEGQVSLASGEDRGSESDAVEGRVLTAQEFSGLARLCSSAVNDNGNGYARAPYAALLDEGYAAGEIAAVWAARQRACELRGAAPEFYPNLAEFLRGKGSRSARRAMERARKERRRKDAQAARLEAERAKEAEDASREERLREDPTYAAIAEKLALCRDALAASLAHRPGSGSVDEARAAHAKALAEREAWLRLVDSWPTRKDQ